MASLTIYDRAGKEVGKYDVDPKVFPREINKQLLHDVVVMYQANLRQGTHASKSRGMIAGSTKKMYRQKGTGNAARVRGAVPSAAAAGTRSAKTRATSATACRARRCNWPRAWPLPAA